MSNDLCLTKILLLLLSTAVDKYGYNKAMFNQYNHKKIIFLSFRF